jgi:DNA-binding response OmpR family regulator
VTTHKILVIDDSRMIRRSVKDMLAGFEVLEAKDGQEGLKAIHTDHPNLIMLDWLMHPMGGWDVYQELQKDPRLKTIPLVVMSGRKEEVTDKISEPFNYFAFVEKPFEKKQLVDAIKEAMKKAKTIPQSAPVAAETATPTGEVSEAMAQEIQELKAQVAKMQTEINGLKKKMEQLVGFIQKKLK